MLDASEKMARMLQAIYVALVAGLLALVATILQLRHNAKQRDLERKMQLRRDVFFEAADGLAGTAFYFARIANANLPVEKLVDSEVRNGWLNKLLLVAPLDANQAVGAANADLNAFVFKLLRLRVAVEAVKSEINSIDKEIEKLAGFPKWFREAAGREAAGEGPFTAELLTRLLPYLQAWTDNRSGELHGKRSDLWKRRADLERSLIEEAMVSQGQYQKKLRRAMFALRNELDLKTDDASFASFETSMAEKDAEVLLSLRKAFDGIEMDAEKWHDQHHGG